jgi:hypothetical protein
LKRPDLAGQTYASVKTAGGKVALFIDSGVVHGSPLDAYQALTADPITAAIGTHTDIARIEYLPYTPA